MARHATSDEPIGLLAAWGDYPLVVARELKHSGYRVACVAVSGHADPALEALCDRTCWIGPAQLGKPIRFFRQLGVRRATMAGKFHKVQIYQPWVWARFIPDWTFLRAFYPHFVGRSADRRDDTLLGVIVKAFAQHGVEFLPATDFASNLLISPGRIAGGPLTVDQEADVAFGWRMAKAMGGLDVGQSVCVRGRAVIAVEAIEGTDACIRRAGALCRQGGFSVVKVAKPDQDMRFDVPTVGLGTLRTMVESGARVLAVEADKTILLDRPEFERFAKAHGLTVVSLAAEGVRACA